MIYDRNIMARTLPPRPTTPPPSTPVPNEIKVLIAGALLIALGFGLIAPILPQYASSFDVNHMMAAAIVSVFAFTRLAFAPFAGGVSEKLGEPGAYVLGVMIVALSTIACGLAPNYWTLIVVRGIGGIGSVTFTVAASSFIARTSPPDIRGRIAGLYGGAFLIGNVCGPLVGGLLAPLGYRVPFFIYGGSLIAASLVVFYFLVSSRGRQGQPRERHNLPPYSLADALANPKYRAALLSNFGNGWMSFGVRVAIVPLFAAQVLGLDPLAVGLVMTCFAAGNAAALTFSGRWSDRVGRRRPIIIGLSLAAVCSAAIGLSPNLALLVVLSLLSGFGTGIFNPAQQAAVADIVGPEHHAGRVMSMFQMAADLPAMIAPLIAGWIADHFGFSWAFILSGVIMGIGVIAWILVAPRQSIDHTEVTPRKGS